MSSDLIKNKNYQEILYILAWYSLKPEIPQVTEV